MFVWCFILLIFLLNIATIIRTYGDYVNYQMNMNVYEYEQVDIEQLCRLSKCNYVVQESSSPNVLDVFQYEDEAGILYRDYKSFNKDEDINIKHLLGYFYYIENLGLSIKLEDTENFFVLDIFAITDKLIYPYIIAFLCTYLSVIWFLFISFRREEKEHIMSTIGTEAVLTNKTTLHLAENVHHELNTPLEVVDNKVRKINKAIDNFVMSIYEEQNLNTIGTKIGAFIKELLLLNKDFEFIYTSIEQVHSVLDKMRGYKHLKYSNGNKTIYDIIYGAVKSSSISNGNFDFEIDSELYNYKINSTILQNVAVLGVIINHIKNSLEAKATKVLFKKDKFKDGKLLISIIDNGNGIPENVRKNIFKANYSSKQSNNSVRGNGMFINKYLMKEGGGDIRVIDTSECGTIIEISIPAKNPKLL